MANNTTLIVSPEHGRNIDPNGIQDANAFLGYDHSDANSTRTFNIMVGPGIDANLSIGSESNQVGDIVDLTPRGIRDHLELHKPIYKNSAAYGHFGREAENDGSFSWEKTDLVDQLKNL